MEAAWWLSRDKPTLLLLCSSAEGTGFFEEVEPFDMDPETWWFDESAPSSDQPTFRAINWEGQSIH